MPKTMTSTLRSATLSRPSWATGGLSLLVVAFLGGSGMAHRNTPDPLDRLVDEQRRAWNTQTSTVFDADAAPRARRDNGLECASLRRRVAPSRVFSELQSSAERLVALDPMMKRLRRILVAKRSSPRSGHSSAIPAGSGEGQPS